MYICKRFTCCLCYDCCCSILYKINIFETEKGDFLRAIWQYCLQARLQSGHVIGLYIDQTIVFSIDYSLGYSQNYSFAHRFDYRLVYRPDDSFVYRPDDSFDNISDDSFIYKSDSSIFYIPNDSFLCRSESSCLQTSPKSCPVQSLVYRPD